MTSTYTPLRPVWLDIHPKDQIFDLLSMNQVLLGQVWYRPIDAGFEIDYIEILENHRGQGFGSELLVRFIEFCKTHKLSKGEVWLEVSAENMVAIKTYLKAGFKHVGRRKNYYQDGTDAILMNLKYF